MVFTEILGAELQTKDGVKPTEELLAGKKYVGIYFSAHWCPPCRAFTPVLSDAYKSFVEEGHNDVAIVFLSWDEEEAGFNEYYEQMPFYAVPFARRDIKEVLTEEKYGVKSIPTLIWLNTNGEVVTKGGRNLVVDARGKPDRILEALAKF
ncbi:hypothetical protein AC1031_008105 [Aphanomyces cochlioides]|nr:hypothetical protein AC1031_008105 [Aphanomyces cochlioides]